MGIISGAVSSIDEPNTLWHEATFKARPDRIGIDFKLRAAEGCDAVDSNARRGSAQALACSAALKTFNEPELIASILIGRGYNTPEQVSRLLSSDLLSELPDVTTLKGFEQASYLIARHIQEQNLIGIICDYDTDGTCGGALLGAALRFFGGHAIVRSPDRTIDGYGLNTRQITELSQIGCRLLIAVDIGTKNYAEITYAKGLGMQVVVIDHHIPNEEMLPQAEAFINPIQSGCNFADGLMSAGALAWVVAWGANEYMHNGRYDVSAGREFIGRELLPLAAIATVGDVSPLIRVNRALVREGLKAMQQSVFPGISELLRISNVVGEPKAEDLAFGVSPRINAAGRVAALADLGVSGGEFVISLLSTINSGKARELALQLNEYNRLRQEIEEQTARTVFKSVANCPDLPGAIVCAEESLHHGTLGIVAARVMNRFRRTTALITGNGDGLWRGSVRGVDGDNVALMLEQTGDLLDKFGGHTAAGGFGIKKENIPAFNQRFIEAASTRSAPSSITIDAELSLTMCRQTQDRLLQDFAKLEPFGRGNPSPVFMAPAVDVLYCRPLKDRHLLVTLRERGTFIRGVMWHGSGYEALSQPGKVDLVYRPVADKFQAFHDGVSSVQIEVVAARQTRAG